MVTKNREQFLQKMEQYNLYLHIKGLEAMLRNIMLMKLDKYFPNVLERKLELLEEDY